MFRKAWSAISNWFTARDLWQVLSTVFSAPIAIAVAQYKEMDQSHILLIGMFTAILVLLATNIWIALRQRQLSTNNSKGHVEGASNRPQFLDIDGEKSKLDWFGNECVLDDPILQFMDAAIDDMKRYEVILDCPSYALAKLKYELYTHDASHNPSVVIRLVGSRKSPYLEGSGELEVQVDKNKNVEYVVDRDGVPSDVELWLKVHLIGWKERE